MAMTPDEAREYLAELAASGQTEWQPTKNLDEYKDAQVVRKAREFQQMERSGLPIDNRVARGHGKSEKGRIPKLDAPSSAYDMAREGRRAGVDVTFNRDEQSGKFISEIAPANDADAERTIDFLTTAAPGTHVQIKYEDADGRWHLIYAKNGRDIDSLFAAFGASEYDSFEDWLADESEDVYTSDGDACYAPGGSYAIVAVAR